MQPHVALREPLFEKTTPGSNHVRRNSRASVLEFPAVDISADKAASEAAGVSVHKDMHPGVYKIAVFSWAIFMAIFWLTFWVSANALFMVVISTAYAIMFFGVPYVMSRFVPNPARAELGLIHFLRGKVDTLYGPVNSLEALVQVIMVPAALSFGGLAMAFVIHAARVVH